MEADFEITGAEPTDAEGLAALHVATWRETYGHLLPSRFYDDNAIVQRQGMWTRVLAREDARRRVSVARSGEGLIGFAFHGAPEEANPARRLDLRAIYVLARWHGSGVGQALLDACIGDRPAQLWVARENPRARRFYERNGFTVDGEEKSDPDLDGFVEIRMVR